MPQDAGHSLETGGSCHTTLSASPTTSGIIPSLFIRFLNTTDTDKGTAVNHHRRSPGLSRGLLGGGTYAKPSGPCPRDALSTRVEETWDVAWWTYIWRGVLANHLGSSNHFVF